MPAHKGVSPANFIDRTGYQYHWLTVLFRAEGSSKWVVYWLCRCKCGKETIVSTANLISGQVKSCGCMTAWDTRKKVPNRLPLYTVWRNMLQRCSAETGPDFERYKKRGVVVCEEWSHDFYAFYRDMYPTWGRGLTLERKDNNGLYNRENCCWVTRKQQARNTRKNRIVEIDGIKGCMAEVCERLKLSRKRLENHMYRKGATPQEAADAYRRFLKKGRNYDHLKKRHF